MRQLIDPKTSEPKLKLPRKFCCEIMKVHLTRDCTIHDYIECADNVIAYLGRGKYGLLIHDGGSSVYSINYCPWCGKKLGR